MAQIVECRHLVSYVFFPRFLLKGEVVVVGIRALLASVGRIGWWLLRAHAQMHSLPPLSKASPSPLLVGGACCAPRPITVKGVFLSCRDRVSS